MKTVSFTITMTKRNDKSLVALDDLFLDSILSTCPVKIGQTTRLISHNFYRFWLWTYEVFHSIWPKIMACAYASQRGRSPGPELSHKALRFRSKSADFPPFCVYRTLCRSNCDIQSSLSSHDDSDPARLHHIILRKQRQIYFVVVIP